MSTGGSGVLRERPPALTETGVLRERPPALTETGGFRPRAGLDESALAQDRVARAVSRAKLGDVEAFRFIYACYADNIYGYVRSILRDDHDAEDLTQQVFAKLITAIVKYDDRGVPFFAWLLRLARNLTIDHVRRNRAVPAAGLFDDTAADSVDLDRPQTLRAAFQTLPQDQRQVVFLRHVVGLSPGEIAEQMGRTEGSIHGLHHRGRLALQRELLRLQAVPLTRTPAPAAERPYEPGEVLRRAA